jgi:hypothetical protein
MATDATILKQAIIDYLNNTCGWNISNSPQGECMAEAIAEAVVDHIINYAETDEQSKQTHSHNVF